MMIGFEDSFYGEFIHLYKDHNIVVGGCVMITPTELKTIYDKVTEFIELESQPSAVDNTPQQPAPLLA